MKLFGSGSSKHSGKGASEPEEYYEDEYEEYEDEEYDSEPTAPKPKDLKEPLTKKQLRNRILISIVAATLAIIAGMCAAAAVMLRPPKVKQESTTPAPAVVRPVKKDPATEEDEEDPMAELDEGDALEVDMGNRREGVYTVLVAATDIDETRTDALMVATLDTVNDTVNVINIPRDLMSNCGRTGDAKKINAAYGTKNGIETTKSEVKKVLGFTPDQYVVVNFNGVAEIIDALGGVTYEVPWRMKYDDPTQDLHIDFQPGETEMDGKAAVEFMRWRKNNSGVSTGVKGTTGGDEERIEKDQKFLKFLAKEVFSLSNVTKIPSLAQVVFKNVKTDLTAGEVLWLAWQLYDVKNEDINMMTLPGYGQMSYAGTGTMYSFYFPYRSQVLEMVNEFINPYEKDITSIDVVSGPSSSGSSKSNSTKSSSSSTQTSTKPKEETEDEKKDEDSESTDTPNEQSGSESTGSRNSGSSNSGNSGNSSGNSSSGGNGDDDESGSENEGGGSTGSGNEGGDGSELSGEEPTGEPVSGGEAQPNAEGGNGTETPANEAPPVETNSGSEPQQSETPPAAPAAPSGFPEGMFAPGTTLE